MNLFPHSRLIRKVFIKSFWKRCVAASIFWQPRVPLIRHKALSARPVSVLPGFRDERGEGFEVLLFALDE